MTRLGSFVLIAALLTPLAGCFPLSAVDVGLLVLSMPAGTGSGSVSLKGYTLGPVSSPEFPDLLRQAIPAGEGEVYITGRAQWTGLMKVRQPGFYAWQTVAATTDSALLFLWWHKDEERYKIMLRLPYADIESVTLEGTGRRTEIRLCHGVEEYAVGDQTLDINRLTRLQFMTAGGSWDFEMTESAFEILNEKIIHKEGLGSTPDACEEAEKSDAENIGFGQDGLLD